MNTAKNTALQCIDDKINEGKTIVDNAINDIRTAAQNISGAAQLMEQCKQYTVQFPSMAGLVAKVSCFGQVWQINGIAITIENDQFPFSFCSFSLDLGIAYDEK